ncbi:MAG: precorrin-8X methylmutase [Cyanobacteria bacterium P01_D01_bin.44]
MPSFEDHPIVYQSFAVIDQEIGAYDLTPEAYAVVRRVIHATADFEFKDLLHFSEDAIAAATKALPTGCPIVTDVGMVAQGIRRIVGETFKNPVIAAIEQAPDQVLPGQTRTEAGVLRCAQQYPQALFVIGNAPTALLALCRQVAQGTVHPSLIVGAPVGFINVSESKQALGDLAIPRIWVAGRKGGSGVAAAIVNALVILAWERGVGSG